MVRSLLRNPVNVGLASPTNFPVFMPVFCPHPFHRFPSHSAGLTRRWQGARYALCVRSGTIAGGRPSQDSDVKTRSMGGNDLCGISDISLCPEMRLACGSTNGHYLLYTLH